MHALSKHRRIVVRLAVPLAAAAVVIASPMGARAESSGHGTHHAKPAFPPNDDFVFATSLPGQSDSINSGQFNIGATAEIGEPQHKPGVPAHASVWYRWTSPVTGHVVFRTLGSDFDTVLAAYTGQALTTLTQVATNDDTPMSDGSSLQSEIGFQALKGTQYSIAVDSFNPQDTGDIRLSWTTNDDFDAAEVLEPGTLDDVRFANSDTNGATAQVGEPAHNGFDAGASVWFSWKAPATGLARFTTFGNEFDTVLAAYTGPSVGDLKLLDQNDDTSQGTLASEITFDAVQGKTYRIALTGAFTGDNRSLGFTLLRYGVETPTLSIDNVAAAEGDSGTSTMTLHVTLSAKSPSTVAVSFATQDGTATAGSDYKATSGRLTFKPGQKSKLVTVVVRGDTTVEPLETFSVNLSNPSGGGVTVLDGQGIGSIIADD